MASFERRAVTDLRLANNDRRFFRLFLRLLDRLSDRGNVVGMRHEIDVQDLTVLRLEAGAHVLFERDVCVAFDRDVVVVVEHDQLAEFVRARERAGFVRNAFFETAVSAQRVGVVIHDGESLTVKSCGEVRFRDRHAHGVRNALTQRSRRRFDSDGMTVFGMPRRFGAELTEVHQIFFRKPETV